MPRARIGELDIFHEVAGAGEPVLLLMGLGGDHQGWELVRADLARRHRLVLVDNRDAGESAEARDGYGLADMATDALAVMDHVGVERFHVVGASMGGAVAQHLAPLAPTRVATLVLVSTWGRTDAFLAAVFRGWRLLVERLTPEEFLGMQLPWAFTHRFLESPRPDMVAVPTRSVAAYQRQVDACLAHDVLGLLPLLRTPALVLAGEEDILTPPRYGRAVAAALGRGEMALLPATAHACFLETPKPFVQRVLAFLAQHPLAS